jgi:hypothetical protein
MTKGFLMGYVRAAPQSIHRDHRSPSHRTSGYVLNCSLAFRSEEEDRMRRSTWSIMCTVAMLCLGLGAPVATALDGRLANATVSFGEWQTDPPLDRFPNSSPADRNEHQLIPGNVIIPAGGSINYLISGLHQPIVYEDGTQPEDIDVEKTTTTTGMPAGVLLIDDPANRIYRGVDPSLYPRDRSEVVHFPKAGIYLVICGVRDHFVNDGMFGYVTVFPRAIDKD